MITNSPPPQKFMVEKINPIQNRWKKSIWLTTFKMAENLLNVGWKFIKW